MNEERINYEDVASLVEGADDSPDESVCEIHCANMVCLWVIISYADGLVYNLSVCRASKRFW